MQESYPLEVESWVSMKDQIPKMTVFSFSNFISFGCDPVYIVLGFSGVYRYFSRLLNAYSFANGKTMLSILLLFICIYVIMTVCQSILQIECH